MARPFHDSRCAPCAPMCPVFYHRFVTAAEPFPLLHQCFLATIVIRVVAAESPENDGLQKKWGQRRSKRLIAPVIDAFANSQLLPLKPFTSSDHRGANTVDVQSLDFTTHEVIQLQSSQIITDFCDLCPVSQGVLLCPAKLELPG